MKKIMRILCILFACLITAMAMFSCSSPGNNNDSENQNQNQNSPVNDNNDDNNNNIGSDESDDKKEPEVDSVSIIAGLPEADYGGYGFRIWTSNWFNTTLEGRQAPEEEQTGDLINDALYIRDKLVEEKYNIQIIYTIHDPDPGAFAAKATKAVKAGDDSFDFAMGDMMNVTKGLAQTGAIYDFNQIPNIDLTKEWWSKYAIRDLTINGKFYFPAGDISARYPGSQVMMFFNKQVFADLGIDYPYQLVTDGKWTLDAFQNMIKGQTRDVNGDGKFDRSDAYGFIGNGSGYNLFRSCGEGVVKVTDGNPSLNLNTEKSIAIMDSLTSFMGNIDYMYYESGFASYDEVPMFKENRVMFILQTGTNASLYRDMESDFGIVPLPKFNEAQDDHYSFCQAWGSTAVCVPQTNENIERTGMIIESLAAVGKYTSTPAAYDVTLKRKYMRDDESENMLDIIVAGSCYDLAMMYDWGGIFSSFYSSMDKGESFIAKYESVEPKALAAMEKTIAIFEGSE
ncbi:MAG: hypothetical protein FWF92_09915 [Oscillospiraceae bacterium]|nr:hypothetical protein [Oscillospiraceae bacterium]